MLTIPVGRVIEKLDEILSHANYERAEKHLLYWMEEAMAVNDIRGELSVCNELMGLYRKIDKKDDAISFAERSIGLIEKGEFGGTITAGTTYVNAATVYKAFEDFDKALPLYEQAKSIYEENLEPGDARLGGLYNNMALLLTDIKRYDEADAMYEQAKTIMAKKPDGCLEVAITCLNQANLAEARFGLENADKKISELLDEAERLLDTPDIANGGYYAFVCLKCAPTFAYYGRFAYEKKLKERADSVYERAGTF